MLAVIKKELKSYFLSPIGYVFIGLFLIMLSLIFTAEILEYYQTNNFEYIFYSGATILTFVIPVITMRTFAEERKNGTEQLLMTSPLSLTKIVLAKFIAATIVVIITEICTLLYFAVLSYYAMPNIPIALCTLLGFLLLAMAYISFGIFASSITENQIVSFVITVGFFIASWFLPEISSIFDNFSLINIFSGFLYGQISIADTVTLVAFTVLCLILTIIVLQRRKSVQ
jgi:ABC-2 type transport system permease protein